MSEPIRLGMEAQLAALRAAEARGDRRAGWKIGFNDPVVQRRFGLSAPLVGHLLASRSLASGATCKLPDGAQARVEVEIAIELGRDVDPDADLAGARAAIAHLRPALEIVDFARPADGIQAILAHDIFQEAVVFGGAGTGRTGPSLEGVAARATKNGAAAGSGGLELVPADLGEVVLHVATTLGRFGEKLAAGEHIIAGALFPPIPVTRGDRIEADLGALGRVEVRLI